MHDQDEQHVGMIVVFPEDSAELDATAQEQLRQIAVLMAGKPQKIEIRGHASRRPLPAGSLFRDAWQLCYARCTAAMAFLERQGISCERMRLSQAGPGEPFSVLPDNRRQASDSRVEIFMLAEFVDEAAKAHATKEPAAHTHGK
jgi:chemotaxis protein MotB